MKQPRIVVTGIGVVTPIGTGRERFWTNLLEGRSGIGPVRSFDTSAYNVHRGAEVHDFEIENYLSNLDAAHLGRASQFAIAAARLALADANVEIASLDLERAGVSMGTTSGEPREVERFDDLFISKKLDRVGREFLALYPSHVIAAHIARELKFAGVNIMIPTACAAGNYAIAHAFDVLRAGRATTRPTPAGSSKGRPARHRNSPLAHRPGRGIMTAGRGPTLQRSLYSILIPSNAWTVPEVARPMRSRRAGPSSPRNTAATPRGRRPGVRPPGTGRSSRSRGDELGRAQAPVAVVIFEHDRIVSGRRRGRRGLALPVGVGTG